MVRACGVGRLKEANQSLDVLCRRCQEELLANELNASQAAQPDLILQFRKQSFDFLALSLPLENSGVLGIFEVSPVRRGMDFTVPQSRGHYIGICLTVGQASPLRFPPLKPLLCAKSVSGKRAPRTSID
jgi:hypothetical protein